MIALFQYYRIAAAYLILLIHQQFWTLSPPMGRLTGVAVPLFAAMAGVLFARTMDGTIHLPLVLSKKTRRILVPYLIWAVVYWLANCVVLDGCIRHEEIAVPSFRSWLLGGTACHLWFLPCLFMAFGVFGGCACLARRLSIHWGWFAAGILVVAAAAQFLSDSTSVTLGGYVRFYLGRLLFYFACGCLVALVPNVGSINCRIMGGGMILIGYANVVWNLIGGLVWNPLPLVMGLLLIARAKPNVALPPWMSKLADASMGIYLVHVLLTSGVQAVLQSVGWLTLPDVFALLLSFALFGAAYLSVRILPKGLF